jgi:hypothetical protein
MPGRVQQHADMRLRLVVGEAGSQCNGVGYGDVEVSRWCESACAER